MALLPLAVAATLVLGLEEAFCSGLLRGALAWFLLLPFCFAWRQCELQGPTVVISLPSDSNNSCSGPPFSLFYLRHSAASSLPAAAGLHRSFSPSLTEGDHSFCSALDASRGSSDGATQTHGATAGAAIGIAASAPLRSVFMFRAAGLLTALRPSSQRVVGAAYPLAGISIGAVTGLAIYNARHTMSRHIDDIQVHPFY